MNEGSHILLRKNVEVLYLTAYPGGVYNAYIPRGMVGK